MDKIFAPIKKRIIEYIDYKNITKENFYAVTGISASNFKGEGLKSEIGGDKLAKILSIFGDVDAEWLLTGKGEMIKKIIPNAIDKRKTLGETRPRIPFNAAAGTLTVAIEGVKKTNCELIPTIHAFSRYDFTIIAHGDSMEPEYHSGDELACLYVKNSNFIQWGRCHVLDTAQGIILKRIFDDGECIICKSDNPDYPDFSIHKSDIYNLALVIGMLRRY